MDPIKVEGITKWPVPTTVKQVRSFLGFCNFYCVFIPKFSDIARPLNDLTKKNYQWHWDTSQQYAFEELKRNAYVPKNQYYVPLIGINLSLWRLTPLDMP